MNEPIYGIPPDLVRGPEADVLPLAGEANWGMEWPGIKQLREAARNGEGIKLGVVDTGIDPEHPALSGVFAGGRDFTGSAIGFRDRNGHGTHCSGTVGSSMASIGVAPGCRLYHGKGLSDSGSGGMTQLLSAIEWCLSEGCNVVSNSWGGGTTIDSATARRLREWSERGAWLIFAAGNDGGGTSQTSAPGNSPDVINCAALNRDLSPASFTSAGSKIDTAAPGVGIWSAKPGGGFQQMSGTSMATPYLAGTLGLFRRALELLGYQIPTVTALRALLTNQSTDTHTPGRDNRTGPGWVTPLLLYLSLTPAPLPVQR